MRRVAEIVQLQAPHPFTQSLETAAKASEKPPIDWNLGREVTKDELAKVDKGEVCCKRDGTDNPPPLYDEYYKEWPKYEVTFAQTHVLT